MARYIKFIVLAIFIIQFVAAIRHGFEPELLHVDKDVQLRSPKIIEPEAFDGFLHNGRTKRSLKGPDANIPQTIKNNSTTDLPNDKLAASNSLASPDTSNTSNLTQQVHNNITTMVSRESVSCLSFLICSNVKCIDVFVVIVMRLGECLCVCVCATECQSVRVIFIRN